MAGPALGLGVALALLVTAAGCTTFKRFAYSGFGRDDWQQPDRVVEALAIAPGAQVADLGAGGGYFTFRLAEAVGPEGRVFAVDVDEGMIGYLNEESRERGLAQVEARLSAPDDPGLPAESLDLLFTCNTYHHLTDRSAYFERVRASLRPGGRVAIIDFKTEAGIRHGSERAVIEAELEAAGYRLLAAPDFLERQHFLIFSPAPLH